MAVPSGLGSEVLKSFTGNIQNNSFELTAGTDEIITVLGWMVMGAGSSQSKLYAYFRRSSTDYQFLYQFVQVNETFMWNDKIVLEPGDTLKLTEVNNQIMPYNGNYILQDWAA